MSIRPGMPGRPVSGPRPTAPRPGPLTRPEVPVGHLMMRSGAFLVTALCSGPPRPLGGTGGWQPRDRDQRDGYVAYQGTELAGWEIDLVIGTLVRPRSIRLERLALLAMCSPGKRGGDFFVPSPFEAFGPGDVEGVFVCESLNRGQEDYLPDGVTPIMLEATLRMRVYELPDVASAKLDRATSAAQSKAKQQKAKDDAESKAQKEYALALAKAKKRAAG